MLSRSYLEKHFKKFEFPLEIVFKDISEFDVQNLITGYSLSEIESRKLTDQKVYKYLRKGQSTRDIERKIRCFAKLIDMMTMTMIIIFICLPHQILFLRIRCQIIHHNFLCFYIFPPIQSFNEMSPKSSFSSFNEMSIQIYIKNHCLMIQQM